MICMAHPKRHNGLFAPCCVTSPIFFAKVERLAGEGEWWWYVQSGLVTPDPKGKGSAGNHQKVAKLFSLDVCPMAVGVGWFSMLGRPTSRPYIASALNYCHRPISYRPCFTDE